MSIWTTIALVAALAAILAFVAGRLLSLHRASPQLDPAQQAPEDAPSDVNEPESEEVPSQTETVVWDDDGWWVPDGIPVLVAPSSNMHADPSAQRVREHVRAAIDDPNVDLPAFPLAAQRALELMQNEDVDYGRLAEIVGEDQALAAGVLRLAHSAAYARLFKIDRLDLAFARLGHSTVRLVLIAKSLKQITTSTPAGDRDIGTELWSGAIVSGVLLKHMSPHYDLLKDEAFLVGLLHDIGKLAILRVLDDYDRAHGGTLSPVMFDWLCDECHEEFGLRLARAWSLQEPLPDLIGDHHQPTTPKNRLSRYRLLLQFSDVVAAMTRYTPYIPYDLFNLPCVQELNINNTPETRRWLAGLPALIAEKAGDF